ncbi:MAG: PKD domain-containing protein [Verrucomicrobiota bacterium]
MNRLSQIAVVVVALLAGRVDAATMQLASTNVATGASLSVPLTINNTTGALGDYAVTVSFDTNVVRFVSVTGGNGQFAAGPAIVSTNTPGQVRFVHQQTVSITAPTGTVVVSRVNFTAIGAAGSSSAVRLAKASADNTAGQTLPLTGLTDGSVQIAGAPVAPVAAFSASPTAGAVSLPVSFTDSSTGTITNRTWNFGDGVTTNVSGTSVAHTYTQAGTYSVSLTVTGPGGFNALSKPNYITVTNVVVTSYTINTSAAPVVGGSVSGGGSQTAGASVTVLATANAGYSFVNWTEGGTPVSASASYTFTANANRTLVANFSQITYTINTSAAPLVGGSTLGGGSKTAGASVTVIATANAGYSFVNWTESGSAVSVSPSYSFTASSSRTLVANFETASTTNEAVTITTEPTVTNSLMRVGSTVVIVADEASAFSVGAVSATGKPLFYAWQFGDGAGSSRSSTSSATHLYPPECGNFNATVAVDDGKVTNAASLTVSVACALEVIKLQAKPNFGRENSDSCSLKGMVALPADSILTGKLLTVNIGEAQVSFVLDSKGNGVNGRHTCRLKLNKRTGTWALSAALRNGDWHNTWALSGLSDANIPKPGAATKLTAVVLIEKESFAAEKPVVYTAKQGISGTAQ